MTTPTVKSNLKLFIILEPFETTQPKDFSFELKYGYP